MQISIPCLVLVLTAGAGCTSSEEQELATARARWTDHHQQTYVFTWHHSCECETDVLRPVEIEVQNGAILRATYVDDQTAVGEPIRGQLLAIDGVFDKIQAAIDSGAAELRITYDPAWGFPSSVFVDYDRHIADEELVLQLTDFTPISR